MHQIETGARTLKFNTSLAFGVMWSKTFPIQLRPREDSNGDRARISELGYFNRPFGKHPALLLSGVSFPIMHTETTQSCLYLLQAGRQMQKSRHAYYE